MTSPDDVIFLKFSEIHGQYFPLSNFKKKDTLVFSSLSSIRLGLSPKGLVKRKRPTQHETTTYRHRFVRAAPAPRAKRKDSNNRGRASSVTRQSIFRSAARVVKCKQLSCAHMARHAQHLRFCRGVKRQNQN